MFITTASFHFMVLYVLFSFLFSQLPFFCTSCQSCQMKCTSLAVQKLIHKSSFVGSVYYMTRRNCTGNISAIANVYVFVSCIGTVVHYGFTASTN